MHRLGQVYEVINTMTDIQRGFLTLDNPVSHLPLTSPLNIRLNHIISHLPELLRAGKLRQEVTALNAEMANATIDIDDGNIQQQNAAILILLMIAQGYVWENPCQPENMIPAILARNIYSLCKSQQRFPALTYADYVLYNWKLKDSSKEISLDNIEPLATFTGQSDEAWFITIHVVIEAVCGKALEAAFQASRLAHVVKTTHQPWSPTVEIQLCEYLEKISLTLQEAMDILSKMQDGCDPHFYWSTLRHYLNGWEKVKTDTDNDANHGVYFDGVVIHGKMPKFRYKGPSGAQSSIMPALDAALGLNHDIDEMYQTLLAFQQYMPPNHMLFIQVMKLSELKHLIQTINSSALTEAWKNALHYLGVFRLEHLKLVQQYIYHPAEKQGLSTLDLTGTGGSPLSQYLGSRYESTRNNS